MHEELFSIGRLSKIAKVSIDTIRYYDSIGLLKPAYISEDTGYRYYGTGQVEMLDKIKELKDYGFSLNEIKKMPIEDETKMLEFFRNRYWKLLQEKDNLQATIDRLYEIIK